MNRVLSISAALAVALLAVTAPADATQKGEAPTLLRSAHNRLCGVTHWSYVLHDK